MSAIGSSSSVSRNGPVAGAPCLHRGGADAAWPARLSRGSSHHVRVKGDALLRMLYEPTAQKRAPRTLIDAKFGLPFRVQRHSFMTKSRWAASRRTRSAMQDCWRSRHGSSSNLRRRSSPRRSGLRSVHRPQRRTGAAPPGCSSAGRSGSSDGRGGAGCQIRRCAARAAVPLSAAKSHQLAERIWALSKNRTWGRCSPGRSGPLVAIVRRPGRGATGESARVIHVAVAPVAWCGG